MNINLHIERLILDGLNIGAGQGAQVKVAVEAELTRLLTEGGLAAGLEGGGAISNITAHPMRISGDASPADLGQEIARVVYGGIGT
ncbi:MAG: hypothetical protein ACOYL3_21890 [Desulfuromonadaceae bacterium]